MTTTVLDTISGRCDKCGWIPPKADSVRKTQSHAALSGHTLTVIITREITVNPNGA